MKVLMISRDPKILVAGTPAFMRLQDYRKLFERLEVVVIRGNILSFLSSFIKASRIARKMNHGDFVTSQDPFEAGIVAFVISRVFKLRLQLQLHTDCFDEYYRRHRIINRLRVFCAKVLIPRADRLRVVSEKIANYVREMRLLDMDRISVLPIYTDVERLRESQANSNLKDKFPEFAKVILIVARLEREKNLTLALASFQKILRRIKDVGLIIAGTGKEEKWLREYTRHLGILDNVRFLGWVPDTALLFKSADLMLATSFYEGYGMAVVEALALGCPVVSTDVGIASEAGAVTEPFDPGAIALASLSILQSGKRGMLNPKFIMKKTDYMEKYKNTFI